MRVCGLVFIRADPIVLRVFSKQLVSRLLLLLHRRFTVFQQFLVVIDVPDHPWVQVALLLWLILSTSAPALHRQRCLRGLAISRH